MKSNIIINTLILVVLSAGWMGVTSATVAVDSSSILTEGEPDKYPEYKGGSEAMFQFIRETVVYPKESKKKDEQGKVFVSFVVEKDGKLSEAKVIKSSGFDLLDQEALRVVKKMPDWIPGEKDGEKVRAEYTLPLMFKL